MPRSVNAVASKARRKKILKQAKGFYGKRKNVYTVAKNIVEIQNIEIRILADIKEKRQTKQSFLQQQEKSKTTKT